MGTIAELRAELAVVTDARDALALELEARTSEAVALRGELDATRTALEQRTAERDAQALRAQRETQRADITKDSLDAAHGQILALQVQVGELATQTALLEQARHTLPRRPWGRCGRTWSACGSPSWSAMARSRP